MYGNLTNRIMEAAKFAADLLKPGVGATVTLYSDRDAATVASVEHNGMKTLIAVQLDNYKIVKGSEMDGSAEYEYTANPGARLIYFQIDKEGKAREVTKNRQTNRWNLVVGGRGLILGARDRYYDPSF